MIDAVHVVIGVQGVPAARLIGMDRRAHRDMLADHRDCVAFLADDKGKREAAALAGNDEDLPLAGLFLGEAAIDAVLDFVGRLDLGAKIRAVDFLIAAAVERCVDLIHADQLAQFERENEGRLILAA